MLSRRSFLLAASAGAVALSVRPASAATALPLTIVNNSGEFANTSIWCYLVGTDSAGNQFRVRADGSIAPVSLSDNGSDGFTDYAIPLNASGATTINVPPMSGRLYFALGQKLKFKAVTDGAGRPALQYPAGWVAGDPNYPVLHDFVEFTLDDLGMHCNTTMVDQFSVPLSIQLTGAGSQSTGTLKAGGRAQIFDQARAQPDFANLVVDDLRVIAPGHGLDAGRFSATYFDSYTDAVWAKYAGTDLRLDTGSAVFTGRVGSDGNLMVRDGSGRTASPIRRPSTRDILFCDGALAAPNDGLTGPVAALLGAALNRSTLLDNPNQPVSDPGAFYRTAVTNHYARIMHTATTDGRAYGFAFDDVGGFASYIEDPAPRSCTVTLTPF
ncbi:beta-1,3-glucanase family protein [Amycolatopsis thermoflava]|uniref:beta-1,3-glucanase family protein n=1 Tax=Amycolatopsis thermoflava TaxID=84480 RepID=UPI003F4A5430